MHLRPKNRGRVGVLTALETHIARGIVTFSERNALIVDLYEGGWTQVEIVAALNEPRRQLGAPTLTVDAVAAVIKKARKDKEIT